MSANELLDRLLPESPPDAAVTAEADWYALWAHRVAPAASPPAMALTGALLAPALPWVFVSGYQAALRAVFPELPMEGWAALAASEDRADPAANPPARLETRDGSHFLTGTKSWVAQSRHVDHLVVTAHDAASDETVVVFVDRAQRGVHLGHRDQASFLSAMSQGFARFDDVALREGALLRDPRLRTFMKTESRFVMLACSAWLFARGVRCGAAGAEAARALVLDLFEACRAGDVAPADLAALDRAQQSLLERLEASADFASLPDWETDRRLISMYSPAIQKRASRG